MNHKVKCGLKFFDAGFETCCGWDPRHHRCWDPIAKHIPTLDFALFRKWGGERCYDLWFAGVPTKKSLEAMVMLGAWGMHHKNKMDIL